MTDKPYRIECLFPRDREWQTWSRYATKERRDQALEKLRQNHANIGMQFRAPEDEGDD